MSNGIRTLFGRLAQVRTSLALLGAPVMSGEGSKQGLPPALKVGTVSDLGTIPANPDISGRDGAGQHGVRRQFGLAVWGRLACASEYRRARIDQRLLAKETLFTARHPKLGNVYDARAHSEYDTNRWQTVCITYSRSIGMLPSEVPGSFRSGCNVGDAISGLSFPYSARTAV